MAVPSVTLACQAGGDVGATCETAHRFFQYTILPRIDNFRKGVSDAVAAGSAAPSLVASSFPFGAYFSTAPGGLAALFPQTSLEADLDAAEGCFRHLNNILEEVNRCVQDPVWDIRVRFRIAGCTTNLASIAVCHVGACCVVYCAATDPLRCCAASGSEPISCWPSKQRLSQ